MNARERWGWALVVSVALGLRVLLSFRAGIVESDGAYYCWLARAFARGNVAGGLSTVWPPLYPVLIAAVVRLAALLGTGFSPVVFETAARTVSVGMGVLLLVPLFALARRVVGERGAWAAVAFAAVHPQLVPLSAAALTEATYTTLLVAGIAAWCSGSAAPAGAAFGLAGLVRPEAVVVAVALWAAGLAFGGAARRLRPAFWVAFALVFLPYAAFVTAQTGAPSIGEKGAYNFWRAYQAEYARVLPAPRFLSERVVDSPDLAARLPIERVDVAGFVARAPGVVSSRTLAHAARLATSSLPVESAPVLFVLAIVGAFVVPWRTAWPVALPVVLSIAMYAPLSADRRFLAPVVPFVLVVAGAGAAGLATRLRRPRAFATLVAVVAVAHAAYVIARTHPIDDAPEHRAAGEWLRAHATDWRGGGADAAVMSRKPWVAYYADASYAELPAGGFDVVAERMRRTATRVLVVDARWGVPQRPVLAPLLAKSPGAGSVLLTIDRPRALRLYRVPPGGN